MSDVIATRSKPAAGNAYAGSTGQDQKTLDAIFQHPLSHSLVWRELVALLSNIGDVDEKRNGEFCLHANGETLVANKPHTKDMSADDLVALRQFLARAGWAPDAPAVSTTGDPGPAAGVVVVIDHAGANVFKLGSAGVKASATDGTQVRRLAHHIERQDHDRDRDEDFPDDTRFFEQIAVALGRQGKIVLIGHGKGQSNEAHHLSNYLLAHHKDLQARIASILVADLKHLSVGELLKLGQKALA